jgi:cyclic-di-AMP phosphodiesterase PgpH
LFTAKLDKFYNFIERNKAYFILSDSLTKLLILMPAEQVDLILFPESKSASQNTNNKLIGIPAPTLAEITKSPHSPTKIKQNIFKLKQELAKEIDTALPFSLELWESQLYQSNSKTLDSIKPYLDKAAKKILNYGYSGYIDAFTLKEAVEDLSYFSNARLELIKVILSQSLKPNIRLQLKQLEEKENKTLMDVKPVWLNIPSHSAVLEKGEVITPEKLILLEQLGLNKKEINPKVFGEALCMTLIVFFSFIMFVRFERFKLTFRKMLLLAALILAASASAGLLMSKIPSIIPLAGVAMTIGLFFKPSVGFSAAILFGILCVQALNVSPSVLIPAFIGAIASTVLGQKAKNRADLTYAGLWLGVVQVAAYCLVVFVLKLYPFSSSDLVIQGLNGLATGLIVSSGMPLLEYLFSVVTRFRLLELSDPNQPLLKRLHDEAPGTYEHTLVVADLAQDAAKKIDADYELVRVGILYHDIGKLQNPQIFIENQFGGPNPHENMTPQESAIAIIRHVEDGLEMAKKYGLPEPIRIFIPAHQGNSRAGHFFLKASQLNPNLKDDKDFRYPGPKPNSKETGIAMLADTVEATIRSLQTGDKALVKETIKNLIDARITDNQLSESGLAKYELEKIAESFYESWKNKNHERIRYISDLKK